MSLHQPITVTARACCLPAAGVLALALSGCVAGTASVPVQGGGATPGAFTVTLDGRAFQGEVRPGAAGAELTAAGARPVQGQEVRVAALGMDQGAMAKKAARAGCLSAGGRFNETALGRHDRASGGWVFTGGCA